MTPLLEGWPTKAKEAPYTHEVRLAPLDTNQVFQCLGTWDAPGLKKVIINTFKGNSLESVIENIIFLSSDGASWSFRKILG